MFNHMQTLTYKVSNNNDDILIIASYLGSIYEYSNKGFKI